ncbi:unnamed protein product [Paramecium octaurelia]|uniref:Uncharacterized protein n=1 Tax=Paramecium octaurelia TaxID=43137 RepID=A0A8S1X831_PAROT|nr:unnamed protein product [Paramecium octaurelia]
MNEYQRLDNWDDEKSVWDKSFNGGHGSDMRRFQYGPNNLNLELAYSGLTAVVVITSNLNEATSDVKEFYYFVWNLWE